MRFCRRFRFHNYDKKLLVATRICRSTIKSPLKVLPAFRGGISVRYSINFAVFQIVLLLFHERLTVKQKRYVPEILFIPGIP
jgi:hypothetical protein